MAWHRYQMKHNTVYVLLHKVLHWAAASLLHCYPLFAKGSHQITGAKHSGISSFLVLQ